MKRYALIIFGILVWCTIIIGTLPGYLHTDIFYVNLYDSEAFFDRLKELAVILSIVIPLTFLFSQRQSKIKLSFLDSDWLNSCAVFIVCISTGLLIYYAYILWQNVPRIPDSIVYVFQGKIFAAGKFWAPVPKPLNSFDYMFTLVSDSRYISRYSPGFPLLIAIGMIFRVPWIIPPVFAGGALWLTYRLYIRFYHNRKQALLVLFLMSASPYFLGISGQMLNHAPSLFLYLCFLHMGLSACKQNRAGTALLAGGFLGCFFLTRQLSAIILGGVFFIAFMAEMIKKQHWKAVIGLIAGGSALVFVQLGYNWEFTGNPLKFPFNEGKFGNLDRLGFNHPVKWDVWPEPGLNSPRHTPQKALKNIHLCFSRVNRSLFGWPSSLFFLPMAFFLSIRPRKWDYLFGLSILLMAVGYSFYWFPGAGLLGARYYFEAVSAFIILSVRGITGLQSCLARFWNGRLKWFPALFVLVSTTHGAYYHWPDHIDFTLDAFISEAPKIFDQVEEQALKPAIVFIAGDTTSYSFGFFRNDIFLKQPVIYARDGGYEKNRSILTQYPSRNPYLLQFDSENGHIFELNKNCRIKQELLCKYKEETTVFDQFNSLNPDRWSIHGRAQKLIESKKGNVVVRGLMPENMAPGSFATLEYKDVPFCDFDVSASFKTFVNRDISLSVSISNGRYLDKFQHLTSTILSFTGQDHDGAPCFLFSWKGLGYKWNNNFRTFPGTRKREYNRLHLSLDAKKSIVTAYVNEINIGHAYVPFRSSILKIQLSVFHDGFIERPVHVEWDSFKLVYSNPHEQLEISGDIRHAHIRQEE